MSIKKITLSEDHLKLISAMKFEAFEFDSESRNGRIGWGLDQWNLFGGTYVLEDVALVIGKFDEYIKGTEENPMGRQFPQELEDYMWGLYRYIWDNMEYIIDLILYYVTRGGLKPGTYKYTQNLKQWEYLGENDEK